MSRLLTKFIPFACLSALFQLFSIDLPAQKNDLSAQQLEIVKITACLPPIVVVTGDNRRCPTLSERMAQRHIPGVSIAIIHNEKLEWARGFGVANIEGTPVTPDTLFQAGSISKPVAAMAALYLVQEGKLALDTDVNSKLISWKVELGQFSKNGPVTLRELLNHSAGFGVHGFDGYSADTPVPTVVQILDGTSPANSKPVRLQSAPGSDFSYSGGGYTVMQQLLIDVSGQPFGQFMHTTVLGPLEMTHSTFAQPLPKELRALAATPYEDNGSPVPGGPHTYPELAAAGLWTTPSDLALYAIEIQHAVQGKSSRVLSPDITRQMLTAGLEKRGLGPQIGGSPSNQFFTHDGVNEGFESLLVAYENNGDGAVVMTNAQGGGRLAEELMESIAMVYGWPDFVPVPHTIIKLDDSVLARYEGSYELQPGFDFVFKLKDHQLMLQPTGQSELPIFPEAANRFFMRAFDGQAVFFPSSAFEPTQYMIWHQNGREIKAQKKKSKGLGPP
jgi:CubicO group peptidase (beta-lactamase class C family)